MLSRRPLLVAPLLASGSVWAQQAAKAGGEGEKARALDGPANALAGDWRAPMHHGDETAWLGLRIERSKDGWVAKVSAPVVHVFDVPLGPVHFEGDGLRIGAGWGLQRSRDGRRLLGATPDFLVPRLRLPLVFERGGLEKPARPLPEAPAPSAVWRRDLGAPLWADLLRVGDTLFAGDDAGRLHALDTADGRSRWTATVGGALRARPLWHDGQLLVSSDDGQLHALDAASGQARWTLRLQAEAVQRTPPGQKGSRFDRFGAAAVVAGDCLLTTSHAGELACWHLATRALRWKQALPGPLLGTPAVAEGLVVLGAFDGSVRAFELATGRERWRFETTEPVVSAPWVAQGQVVVGSRSYELFALDLATGRERWRRYHWFSWVESAVAGFNGRLYVGSSDGAHLSALNPTDGRVQWRRDVFGWAWGQPAVDARRAAIGTAALGGYGVAHQAAVWCFDPTDGRLQWRFPLPAPAEKTTYGVTGSLALAPGRVFAPTVGGEVLALASDA